MDLEALITPSDYPDDPNLGLGPSQSADGTYVLPDRPQGPPNGPPNGYPNGPLDGGAGSIDSSLGSDSSMAELQGGDGARGRGGGASVVSASVTGGGVVVGGRGGHPYVTVKRRGRKITGLTAAPDAEHLQLRDAFFERLYLGE